MNILPHFLRNIVNLTDGSLRADLIKEKYQVLTPIMVALYELFLLVAHRGIDEACQLDKDRA